MCNYLIFTKTCHKIYNIIILHLKQIACKFTITFNINYLVGNSSLTLITFDAKIDNTVIASLSFRVLLKSLKIVSVFPLKRFRYNDHCNLLETDPAIKAFHRTSFLRIRNGLITRRKPCIATLFRKRISIERKGEKREEKEKKKKKEKREKKTQNG